MCLRNIASQLKRVHRCSEKVDDVLMFSGGVDKLQSGCITTAELRRILHCCGFHLQDDAFSALLEVSGAGVGKSDNSTNETLVNCQVFCSFLKQLLSNESHDAVAATPKEAEEEYAPYGRGLRGQKHQRVYHSSPARLMVPGTGTALCSMQMAYSFTHKTHFTASVTACNACSCLLVAAIYGMWLACAISMIFSPLNVKCYNNLF